MLARFVVDTGKRKVRFETLEAATTFCNQVHRETNIVLGIVEIPERFVSSVYAKAERAVKNTEKSIRKAV